MLAKAEVLAPDADGHHEHGRPPDHVAQSLVRDDALLHRIAERHRDSALARKLLLVRVQHERQIGHLRAVELGEVLLLRVHEVLDLRLREFAQPDEAAARGDLVAVRLANLRDRRLRGNQRPLFVANW